MRAPASPQVASGPQQRRSYGGVPSFQGQATSKFPSAPNTPRHSQGDLTDSRSSSPVANSRRRLSGLRAPSLATPPKPAPSKLGGPRVADQGPRPAAPGLQSPRVTAAAPGRRGGGGAAGQGQHRASSGLTAPPPPLSTFSAHRPAAVPTSLKSRLPNPHKGFGYNQNN